MRGTIYCLICGAPNVANGERCSHCNEDLRKPITRNLAPQRSGNPYVETGLAGLFAGLVAALVTIGLCVELFRWNRTAGIGGTVAALAFGLALFGVGVRV